MATEPSKPIETAKPRVLADLTQNKPTETKPADKGPMVSHNGQKARTADDEIKAWRRRIRRWHRKAVIALGIDATRDLLTETAKLSQEDTKDDK